MTFSRVSWRLALGPWDPREQEVRFDEYADNNKRVLRFEEMGSALHFCDEVIECRTGPVTIASSFT